MQSGFTAVFPPPCKAAWQQAHTDNIKPMCTHLTQTSRHETNPTESGKTPHLQVELGDVEESLAAGSEALVGLGDAVPPQGLRHHLLQHLQQKGATASIWMTNEL